MDLHCREISMPACLTVPISALFCPKRVILPPSQEKRSSRLLVQPCICRRWMSLACRLEAASVNCLCNVNKQFNYAAKFESEPGLHSHLQYALISPVWKAKYSLYTVWSWKIDNSQVLNSLELILSWNTEVYIFQFWNKCISNKVYNIKGWYNVLSQDVK